jgi:dienelactone hydrolase family protein
VNVPIGKLAHQSHRPSRPDAIDGYGDLAWFRPEESGTTVGHWVYRAEPRSGPSVIVIHEASGLTQKTLGIAAHLLDGGMTPVLPLLVGPALPGRIRGLGIFVKVCVMREFGAVANGEATPTAEWIRSLARRERRDSNGLPVGVIGMCFSGGYAFAAALDDSVKCVVSSQPAFPFAIGRRRRRFGVSRLDLAVLKVNTREGACVRTLRYQRDFLSPSVRHRAIAEVLPNRDQVEIPTCNPFDHAVLGNGVDAKGGTPLAAALSETVAFLRRRLSIEQPDGGPIP